MALETLQPTTHWGGGGSNYVDEGWLESCKPAIQLYSGALATSKVRQGPVSWAGQADWVDDLYEV